MLKLSSGLRHALLAAGWFSCFGLAAAGAIFLLPAAARGADAVVLYVALPALASCIAGSIIGGRVLDPLRTRGPVKASMIGLATAILSFAIYAPLFTLGLQICQPERVHGSLGLMAGTFVIGLAATWPVTLLTGLLAGWLLYLARSRFA